MRKHRTASDGRAIRAGGGFCRSAGNLTRILGFGRDGGRHTPALGTAVFPSCTPTLAPIDAPEREATLNGAERAEFVALAEKREAADAEWLNAAAQLSATHAISLAQALELLNLGVKRRG